MRPNTTLTSQFDTMVETGKNLVSNVEGRLLWLEMLKAIDTSHAQGHPPDR